jgi:hypothetical protein
VIALRLQFAEIGQLGVVVLPGGADRFADDAEISVLARRLYAASTPTGGETVGPMIGAGGSGSSARGDVNGRSWDRLLAA